MKRNRLEKLREDEELLSLNKLNLIISITFEKFQFI